MEVDPHGELVASRKHGSAWPDMNAIHKAFTAAREGGESGALGERLWTQGFPLTNFGDPRYTGWGGAVPIVGGEVIGAIGISGRPRRPTSSSSVGRRRVLSDAAAA